MLSTKDLSLRKKSFVSTLALIEALMTEKIFKVNVDQSLMIPDGHPPPPIKKLILLKMITAEASFYIEQSNTYIQSRINSKAESMDVY